MTIHVFIGEKASHTHENQILQDFLDRLSVRWLDSEDWIYVISNAFWGGAEIDLVCILPNIIVVADFKSHGGKLSGKENGSWFAGSVMVRGGSHSNPFLQLRTNKYAAMEWLKNHDLLPGRNLGHIAAAVVFGRSIEDSVDLSSKVRTWFHITDLDRSARALDALASAQLSISRKEADLIVTELGVRPYRWASAQVRPIAATQGGSGVTVQLTEHQQSRLEQMMAFARDPAQRSLSVQGMTSTGKTTLLREFAGCLNRDGISFRVLYPNRRLASRASSTAASHQESSSFYHHLYFEEGPGHDAPRPDATEDPQQDLLGDRGKNPTSGKESKKKVKQIPLKKCREPDDVIYLVDDAHLLGNGYFETLDGKVFGSGHVVNDFVSFANFAGTRRKVVFFGDPYQLPRISSEDNLLAGKMQHRLCLSHQSLMLDQVYDPGDGQARLRNAIRLVDAMREGRFSSLEFEQDDKFRIIGREEAAKELVESFSSDPYKQWTLFHSNAQVKTFTAWLRQRILKERAQDVLADDELVEIVSAIRWDSAMEERNSLQRGARVSVTPRGKPEIILQSLKGKSRDQTFLLTREALAQAPGRLADGERMDNILLDYLLPESEGFSGDMALAIRLWFEKESKARCAADGLSDSTTGHEAKSDEVTLKEESGIQGVSLLRYGYAATVHHAQGMKQPWCYVDSSHTDPSQSAGYFRWIYTALTVPEQGVVLFNFQPVHPFSGMVWNTRRAKLSASIKLGYGWPLVLGNLSSADEQRDVPPGLDESRTLALSSAAWLQISRPLERHGCRIRSIKSSSYVEQYEVDGPQGAAVLHLSYDGRQIVTGLRVSDKALWPLLKAVANEVVLGAEFSPLARSLVSWLEKRVCNSGWQVVSARETTWRLSLVVAREADEKVELEVNFDKAGRVSTVAVLHFSDESLAEEIRGILQ